MTLTTACENWLKVFDNAALFAINDDSIERVHHTAGDFATAYFKARKNFEGDFYKAITLIKELTALPERKDFAAREKYTKYLADRLDELQTQELPSIPALRAAYFHLKGLDPVGALKTPHVLSTFNTAVLASIPNLNAYHGNLHFREVGLCVLVLMEAEMKYSNFRFPLEEICLTLSTSDSHDLAHTGGNNKPDGVNHIPCYQEERAIAMCTPYLRAMGLDWKFSIRGLQTAIRGTEASQDPAIKEKCNLPRSQLVGKAYDYHFRDGPEPILPPDMIPLLDDTLLLSHSFGSVAPYDVDQSRPHPRTLGALITRFSEIMRLGDILTSVLSMKAQAIRYNQLHKEFPALYPAKPDGLTVNDRLGFFKYVVGGSTDASGNFIPEIPSVGGYVVIRPAIDELYNVKISKTPFITPPSVPGPK